MVKTGWFSESHRHSLAARGIKTKYDYMAQKQYFAGEDATQAGTPAKTADARIFDMKRVGMEKGMTGLRAEQFGRFMVETGFDKEHESYVDEWARRFLRGEEWWNLDNRGTRAYLKVLTNSWRGTARAFDPALLQGVTGSNE